MIADARRLNERIDQEHPGLKRILLGHSMGTMLAQQYEDGRHELFNETNRRQVLDDLVEWLDGVV